MAQMVQPIGVSLFLPSVGVEGYGLTAPELVMLANVALTSEGSGPTGTAEEKQMVELTTVGNSCYSESEDESPLCCATDGHGETPAKVEAGYPRGAEGQAVPALLESSPISTGHKRKRGPCPAEDPRAKKKPFHCKPCQYQAECEEEFLNHISLHSAKKLMAVGQVERETAVGAVEGAAGGKGVIRCERCGYNTNRYDHYTAHLKHHSKGGDSQRVYKCTICTYTTVSQYHWKKHLRNHFPSKLYTCAQCCYFSDRKNNYVQHIRTHTGERPFQCPYCEYTSSQKTHLTRHMRTHSGEKPFKCDSCSYVAANQHEVTRHARQVHGGPKPLSCPHCPYKTADRSNYKKHVELHVSPRQFLCPVCSYAASKKCNLQYHIKSRHPDCAEVTMDVSKVKLRVKSPDPGTTRGSHCQPAEVEEEGAPPVERPEIKMDSDQAEREGSGEEEVTDSKCSSLPADGVVKPVAVEREHGVHDRSRAEQDSQKEDVDQAKSTEMSLEQEKGVGRRGAQKGEGRCEMRGRSGGKPPRSPANTALKEELDNCYTDRPERRRARDGRNTGEPSKPKEPVPKTRPRRECKSSVSWADEKGIEVEEETGSREKTLRSLSKPSGSVVGTARRQVSQEPLRKTRKEAKTKPGMRKSDVMGPPPLEYKNAEESSSNMRSTRRQAESQAQCQGLLVLQNKRNGLRSHSKAEAKEEFSTVMDQPAGVKVRKTTKVTKKNPSLAEKQTAGKVDGVVESSSPKQSPVIEPLLMNLNKPVPLMITCEPQVAPVVIASVKVDSGVKAPKSPGPQYEKIRIKQQKGKRDESKDTLKRRSMVKAAQESEEVERKGRRPRLQLPPAPGAHLDTEEDEGIHSPNGSEVSDSVSEGSDDSGLNGLKAAPSPSVQSEILAKPDTPSLLVQSEMLAKRDTPNPSVQSEMLTKQDTPSLSVQSEMLTKQDTPSLSVQSEMLAEHDTPSPSVQSEMLAEHDTPSPSVQSEMLAKQDTPSPLVQSEMLAKRDTPVLSGQSKMLTEPETPSLVVQSGVLAKPAIVSEANLINSQSRTCIFCDRIFPLEVEYRRHLNRHLVNIYYL